MCPTRYSYVICLIPSTQLADPQDFSLSFLIYLVITFLVHLYQSTGIVGASRRIDSEEAGYTKLNGNGTARPAAHDPDGPEAFELTDRDLDNLSEDEDAAKLGGQDEDEVDWMDPDQREVKRGLRL
jgi:hypothetical protein